MAPFNVSFVPNRGNKLLPSVFFIGQIEGSNFGVIFHGEGSPARHLLLLEPEGNFSSLCGCRQTLNLLGIGCIKPFLRSKKGEEELMFTCETAETLSAVFVGKKLRVLL